MKAKIILGGLLLGDCFHTIPMFNRLINMGFTEIVWITGNYERNVVEFLKLFYPITPIYFDDGQPGSMDDRYKFVSICQNEGGLDGNYDLVIKNPDITFERRDVNFNISPFTEDFTLKEQFLMDSLNILNVPKQEKIVVQPETCHSFKNVIFLKQINWPLPVITVGGLNEYFIPGSLDYRGKPFLDVAIQLKNSKLFVGGHSVVACLSFYIGNLSLICTPPQVKWFDLGQHFHMHQIMVSSAEEIEIKIKEIIND